MTTQLFVYGTLKQGFVNHARYCAGAATIQPAQVWGRLFDLVVGYPALEVPSCQIQQISSGDIARDLLRMPVAAVWQVPVGDWQLIEGELLTFEQPLMQIPPIDQLEECDTGLYRRVCVPVLTHSGCVNAWLYDGSPIDASQVVRRLYQRWPA